MPRMGLEKYKVSHREDLVVTKSEKKLENKERGKGRVRRGGRKRGWEEWRKGKKTERMEAEQKAQPKKVSNGHH